jgi:formylglycine-generating enzyme required for sulfatase activity
MPYRIGAYLIDPEAYEIRHQGGLVSVEPQVFDLLIMLIENRQRVVSKDEMIERVWKGRIVSDATLSSRIKAARQALGDDGSVQKLIRTIHGRGFRFVGDVTHPAPSAAAGAEPNGIGPTQRSDAQVAATTQSNESVGVPVVASIAARPTGTRKWAVTAAASVALLAAVFSVDQLLTRPVVGPGGDGMLTRTALTDSASGAKETAVTFKDCDVCPEMIELPAGAFMMGSPKDERGREQTEGPPRHVAIAQRLALGRFEVTVEQFAAFVAETGGSVGNECRRVDTKTARWGVTEGSFRQPGFDVTGSHPVVCVSLHEAQAYAAWLARRTGKPYRLPSEAEWEYAARAGTTTSYSFGIDEGQLCDHGRFADLGSQFPWRGGCRSDQVTYGPLPVGTLKANAWGFFDMHGNAWEWVADCWTPNAREIPADASAFTRAGACEIGVVRGGGWAAEYRKLRSAQRAPMPATSRLYHTGFRVAVSLGLR